MRKLRCIIIGYLPEPERRYLLENLIGERVSGGGLCEGGADEDCAGGGCTCGKYGFLVGETGDVRVYRAGEGMRWGEKELACFCAEESLFVSGDEEELSAAAKTGMALVRYLFPADGGGARTDEGPGVPCGEADLLVEGFEEVGFSCLERVFWRRHGVPWTILETRRCVVREFSMEYLDALFGLYAGEGMTDYMEPLYEYEKEKEYQQAYIEHIYRFYGYGTWIVCEKDSGALIGRVGIDHREELLGEPELGYAIGVPYQRQGYATEVCRAILSYAKEELGMEKLNCLIEAGNEVSVRVAEKLGFTWAEKMDVNGKEMERYILFL